MYLYRMNLEQRRKERTRLFIEKHDRDKVLIGELISEYFSIVPAPDVKILDFGCGRGVTVEYLRSRGYDAHGCDIQATWGEPGPYALISLEPYRLPYEDNSFDVVYSTSVLEHAKNQEEYFREIRRVLKIGGISLHIFPGKWYLPYEPHVRIPLMNFFWPHCPKWWIFSWIIVRMLYAPKSGIKPGKLLHQYCDFRDNSIIYVTNKRYRQLSMNVFGNFGSLMDFYIERAQGGFARLARKLPFRTISGWISANFRMNVIYQRKEA